MPTRYPSATAVGHHLGHHGGSGFSSWQRRQVLDRLELLLQFQVRINVHRQVDVRMSSYCQMLCFEMSSGGVLQESVDEGLSLKEMEDLLVTVEASPACFGGFSQLEHHGQARRSRAAPLRAAVA
jgi:hypothetical protein